MKVKIRRDSAVNWSAANPVLLDGEIGWDLTNSQMRVGDGTSNWNNLTISSGDDGLRGATGPTGVSGLNGYAPLGIPAASIPFDTIGLPLTINLAGEAKIAQQPARDFTIGNVVGIDALGNDGSGNNAIISHVMYNELDDIFVVTSGMNFYFVTVTGTAVSVGTTFFKQIETTGFGQSNFHIDYNYGRFDMLIPPGSRNLVLAWSASSTISGDGPHVQVFNINVAGNTLDEIASNGINLPIGYIIKFRLVWDADLNAAIAFFIDRFGNNINNIGVLFDDDLNYSGFRNFPALSRLIQGMQDFDICYNKSTKTYIAAYKNTEGTVLSASKIKLLSFKYTLANNSPNIPSRVVELPTTVVYDVWNGGAIGDLELLYICSDNKNNVLLAVPTFNIINEPNAQFYSSVQFIPISVNNDGSFIVGEMKSVAFNSSLSTKLKMTTRFNEIDDYFITITSGEYSGDQVNSFFTRVINNNVAFIKEMNIPVNSPLVAGAFNLQGDMLLGLWDAASQFSYITFIYQHNQQPATTTEIEEFLGYSDENDTVSTTGDIINGFSNLTPMVKYSLDIDGNATTDPTFPPIGVAISSTSILLTRGLQ